MGSKPRRHAQLHIPAPGVSWPVVIPTGKPDEVRDLNQLVLNVEVAEIEKALALFANNKTKAADALQISRFALQRKLEKYGIEIGDS